MNQFWKIPVFNNTIQTWAIALSIIVAAIVTLRLFQSIVIKKVQAYASRTTTSIDDFLIRIIRRSVMPMLYILSIYFGWQYLVISARADNIVHVALLLSMTFFILRIISSFVGYFFNKGLLKSDTDQSRKKQGRGILLIVQAMIWILGLLFLIDNLGYDITTLVAGLGIGGIAIALAAQAILGDLFSYLVIFFDKPFEIGDFIVVDDKMGTIEYVGIKTTRIRTLGGEQLICSNTDLTNSRVHNYKRMHERRVVFSFGIIYATEPRKLRIIPEIIKGVIEKMDNTRFDRAHFQSFGDFSLNFETVYYILSPDYNTYMDIQQSINLKIFEIFDREQIEFAFPTQTLILNNRQAENSF